MNKRTPNQKPTLADVPQSAGDSLQFNGRRLRMNRWGNIGAYVGRAKVGDFGSPHDALEWITNMTSDPNYKPLSTAGELHYRNLDLAMELHCSQRTLETLLEWHGDDLEAVKRQLKAQRDAGADPENLTREATHNLSASLKVRQRLAELLVAIESGDAAKIADAAKLAGDCL